MTVLVTPKFQRLRLHPIDPCIDRPSVPVSTELHDHRRRLERGSKEERERLSNDNRHVRYRRSIPARVDDIHDADEEQPKIKKKTKTRK